MLVMSSLFICYLLERNFKYVHQGICVRRRAKFNKSGYIWETLSITTMTRELPVTRGRAQIHNLGYALLLTRTGAITVVLGYEITAGLA